MLFGDLKPALNFVDVIQIIAEAGTVARAEIVFETRDLAGDLIQNAAIFLKARRTPLRSATVAKEPLEDDARINLMGRGVVGVRQEIVFM